MNKKYMPSNGMEEIAFYGLWCDLCQKDAKYRQTQDGEDGCPILAKATGLCEQPDEWIMNEDGTAKCTAFAAEENPCAAQ